MSKHRYGAYAIPPSGLIPATRIGEPGDGECSVSFLATTGAFVSAAARVRSALSIAQAVLWVIVKVLFVMVAVPLILLFAVASFGAMIFGHGW